MPRAMKLYEAFSHKRLCFRSEGPGGVQAGRAPLAGSRMTDIAGLALQKPSPGIRIGNPLR